MKCSLDGKNARVIAKAVQSLARFGTDLFLEADQQCLQLRSLNANRSAVGTFRFYRSFFESYQVTTGYANYCKVSVKACLTVFRNMKQVEHCEISIDVEQGKFQVKLVCRLETVKNAMIAIVDEENITTAVSAEDMSNVISGSHQIFTEISSNFNAAEEEITFEARGQSLIIKNYIEGSRVNDKFMRSQLKLESREFEKYSVERETGITFCLKEFRAFLLFAETLNENMVLNFDEAGSPIFLTVKNNDKVECILVMSTLSLEDVSFDKDCRPRDVTENNNDNTISSMTQKRKLKNNATNATSPQPSAKRRLANETTLSNDSSSLFQFNGTNDDNQNGCCSAQSIDQPRNTSQRAGRTLESDGQTNLLRAASAVLSFARAALTAAPPPSELFIAFFDSDDNRVQSAKQEAMEEEGQEYVPQSPPRQQGARLRSIFSRCFEATYIPKEPSPNSQVYVPDSDTEE